MGEKLFVIRVRILGNILDNVLGTSFILNYYQVFIKPTFFYLIVY